MADITSGRLIPCLNAKPGIESIKIGEWQRQIGTLAGNELEGIGIDLYEFESNNISVSSTLNNNDEGENYDYEIKFDLIKIDKTTSQTIETLSDLLLFAVVKDEYGNERAYGRESGLSAKISETSGGSKNGFSGYNISLKGKDEVLPFVLTKFDRNILKIINGSLINGESKVITI